MFRARDLNSLYCLALLFLGLVLYCLSQFIFKLGPESHAILHLRRQEASSTLCGFPGNTDLYGLGIRIGYYTQAFSSWLGNFFVLQESKALRPVNTLFMLAMFIGLVWISHSPSETFAVEAFLLLQLLLTTWFVGVKDRSKWTARYWRYDPVRAAIREVSVIAILAYNVWFWWKGLEAFNPTPCGTYIFFLGKVNLYGWYRSAHKVLSITSICFQMFMAAGDALQLLAYTQNRKIQSSEYFTELAEHLLPKPVASIHSVPKPASIVCAPTTEKHPGLKYHDRACSAILECLINSQACTPNGSNNSTTDGACSSKCSSGTKADVPCIVQETSIADASTASRLPASQPSISTPSEPQPPKADSHISSPPQANTNILSFEELYTADNYVSSVLETPSPTPSEARSFRFPHTPIKITLPSARSLRPSTIPLSLLPQIAHNFRLLSSLLIHTYNLHHYPFPTYPSLLNRALTSPHHATISPAALTTILILRTSHLPAHNRKWYYLPSALMTLFFAVGLVLAIELSIYWNGISQTGDMGTVGQLVPFVLGVGGLVKVLWSWVCEGRGEGVEKDGLEEAVERCAEVYYEEKGRRAVGMGMVV